MSLHAIMYVLFFDTQLKSKCEIVSRIIKHANDHEEKQKRPFKIIKIKEDA